MSNFQLPLSDSSNTYSEQMEKSHLMQTCNLLSQYFNGKANLKDLNLIGITGKSEATATKDLLTNMGESSSKTAEQDQKLIDPVRKSATTNSFSEKEVSINKAGSRKEIPNKDQKKAQLSIFYGGKKARAMMLLASKGISHNSYLPIARRSSLYRFLEKRKDRDMDIEPYQMHNPLPSSSKTCEDHFDLNF
ncbi:unnamed protein product [Withania somnifera]